VETDNYKTIAAAAMGYGHCLAAQTPIDVNMCKQLNILLTNMEAAEDRHRSHDGHLATASNTRTR
jgi:acetyl-CoA decarbonylase/synthase complex subunit delta